MAMTSEGGYLPCLNPHCKSQGKSHPNCKCYSHMAEGGEASFCGSPRAHDEGCEYYADGGEVPMEDLPQEAPVSGEVPTTDLPEEHLESKEVPESDLPTDHTTMGEKALTAIEGAGRGLTGGLSDVAFAGMRKGASALGVPDQYLDMVAPSAQDEAAREEQNPLTANLTKAGSMIAGSMTGAGVPGLIEQGAAKAASAMPFLGKVGSGFLKGAISSGLLQGGDEISNAMLGHGDPTAPVASALANMKTTALLGGVAGGAFGGLSKGLEALGKAKFVDKAHDFLAGIGAANSGEIPEGIEASKAFKDGIKFHNEGIKNLIGKASRLPADVLGGYAGEHVADAIGASPAVGASVGVAAAHQFLGPYLEKFLNIPLNSAANKYVVPAVLKVLSGGDGADIANSVSYATNVGKGLQKMTQAVDSIFKGGGQQIYNNEVVDSNREKLRKIIENRELDKQIDEEKTPSNQYYAEGGQIKATPSVMSGSDHLATHFPEQNMLLQAARTRVDGYLNSIRPMPPVGKLPYDSTLPNKHAERFYDKALDIANHPLGVLDHISRGTLTPEHMLHLSKMFPEIQSQVSKQIDKRMVEQQLKKEKLPYKTRQSLTLFMGHPMDSTLTQPSMTSIQQQFAKGSQTPPQQGPKPKHSTSGLDDLAKDAATPNQAREKRSTKP